MSFKETFIEERNYTLMENVMIFDHPLIQHKISILRNKHTGTNEFRALSRRSPCSWVMRPCGTCPWRTWR